MSTGRRGGGARLDGWATGARRSAGGNRSMPVSMNTIRQAGAGPAVAIVAFALGVCAAAPAGAEEDVVGGLEYRNSCAPCHGAGGQGNGPVAEHLNVKPADLTKLTERNDGQFPFLEVFQVIDGRTRVAGHGDRTMPIWGQRYREETGYTDIPI